MVDGAAGEVETFGGRDVVAELGGIMVAVVVGRGVVVGIGAGVVVEVTVLVGGAGTDTPTVTEKLTLADHPGEFVAGAGGVVGVVSVAAGVLEGSSAGGGTSGSGVVSVPGTSSGATGCSAGVGASPTAGSSPGASAGVVGPATPGSLGAAQNSVARSGIPTDNSASSIRDGVLVSAPTTTATPIAVIARADATPARDSCRRRREDADSSR